MAVKALLFSVVVLAISHQTTAQQQLQLPNFSGLFPSSFGGFQLPTFPGFGQSGSGFFAFPFFNGLPNFGGSSSTTSAPASTTAASSERRKRAAEPEDPEQAEQQNRLFFTRFPTITSCNYTTQPGVSCPTCTRALRCLPSNIGIQTNCRGLFRHCNNGRCSLTQSSECASTTTAATTVASTAASTEASTAATSG